MDQLTVLKFFEQNKEYLFPNKKYSYQELQKKLMAAPDNFEVKMKSIPFRKPSTFQLIAFFPGSLGVDRFYLGEIGKGILKYFTFGGFGIWWIKDILSAKERCKTYNCRKLIEAINEPAVIAQMQNTDAKIESISSTVKKIAPVAKELVKGTKELRDTFYINKNRGKFRNFLRLLRYP